MLAALSLLHLLNVLHNFQMFVIYYHILWQRSVFACLATTTRNLSFHDFTFIVLSKKQKSKMWPDLSLFFSLMRAYTKCSWILSCYRAANVPEEAFNRLCTRSGRVLSTNTQLSWRWTGYNFGLDLIMTHDNFMLKLRRNNRTESYTTINHHSKRQLMYR